MMRGSRIAWFRTVLGASALLGASACAAPPSTRMPPSSPNAAPVSAADAPSTTSPIRPTEPSLTTIPQAQDALTRATRELDQAVGVRPIGPEKPAGMTDKAPETTPNKADAPAASSPCANGCRALSSMQRAADSICRLTSDGDERCVTARKKVAESITKLNGCGC